jgi:hypothetical protein
MHVQFTPERLRGLDGTIMKWRVVPTNLMTYWFYPSLSVSDSFPWVKSNNDWLRARRAGYDVIEPTTSALAAEPGLLFLAIAGVVIAAVRLRTDNGRGVLLIGAFAVGAAAILPFAGVSQRYVHDLHPFLTVASALGLAAASYARSSALLVGLIPFTAASLMIMSALSITFQREVAWGVPPERVKQLVNLTLAADIATAALSRRPTAAARLETTIQPGAACIEGEVRVQASDLAVLRCQHGRLVQAIPASIRRFQLILPDQWPLGRREPVLTVGRFGAGEFVLINYPEPDQVRFGFDHWGVGGPWSDPLPVKPGATLDVTVILDRLQDQVTVIVDGRQVLRADIHFYPWDDSEILLGVNAIGGGFDPRFTGRLIAR